MAKSIVIREEYQHKGETKVSWNPIGILVEAKGKQYIKLHHIPGVLCHVFEMEKKQEAGQAEGSEY